jgi:hypothetical protein
VNREGSRSSYRYESADNNKQAERREGSPPNPVP